MRFDNGAADCKAQTSTDDRALVPAPLKLVEQPVAPCRRQAGSFIINGDEDPIIIGLGRNVR